MQEKHQMTTETVKNKNPEKKSFRSALSRLEGSPHSINNEIKKTDREKTQQEA